MLGISTSWTAAREMRIREAVNYIASLGFDTIELGAAHKYETNIFQTLQKIRKEHSDKVFTVHATFPPPKRTFLFNACDGLTSENKGMIENSIKASKIINARITGVHPGYLARYGGAEEHQTIKGFSRFNVIEKINLEEGKKNNHGVIKYYYEEAAKAKINLAIENLIIVDGIKPVLYEKKDFEEMFAQFPKLGFLFDYGHALKEGIKLSEFLNFENVKEIHLHNCTNGQDHMAFSEKDLPRLKELFSYPVTKKVPVVFEFGGQVSEEKVMKEKKSVERLLSIN